MEPWRVDPLFFPFIAFPAVVFLSKEAKEPVDEELQDVPLLPVGAATQHLVWVAAEDGVHSLASCY